MWPKVLTHVALFFNTIATDLFRCDVFSPFFKSILTHFWNTSLRRQMPPLYKNVNTNKLSLLSWDDQLEILTNWIFKSGFQKQHNIGNCLNTTAFDMCLVSSLNSQRCVVGLFPWIFCLITLPTLARTLLPGGFSEGTDSCSLCSLRHWACIVVLL